MTYNVSTSLGTAACHSVVASKSSLNRKVANESQSFYPVTTANATIVQLPTRHVGCWTSTSEKEDETGWKIIHRGELCGTERQRRIPLRLHHDSRRIHVILYNQKCPRSSPRVTTQSQGTTNHTGVEHSGQVFLLVAAKFMTSFLRKGHTTGKGTILQRGILILDFLRGWNLIFSKREVVFTHSFKMPWISSSNSFSERGNVEVCTTRSSIAKTKPNLC
jgi:hypothetical protein